MTGRSILAAADQLQRLPERHSRHIVVGQNRVPALRGQGGLQFRHAVDPVAQGFPPLTLQVALQQQEISLIVLDDQ